MSSGGFKLTRDSFVKENKGNVFETVQQEDMQKEFERQNAYLLNQQYNLNEVTGVQDHKRLDKNAQDRQVEKIDDLLSKMNDTGELQLDAETEVRLRSIKARIMVSKLLDQGGSDSPEMKEIKSYVTALENNLVSNSAKNMTPEVFESLQVAYELVLKSCDAYIENPKKRENLRKKNVRRVRSALAFEADRLKILQKDAREGKFADKTVRDFMGLDTGAQLTGTDAAAEKPISRNGSVASDLFKERFNPSKRLEKDNFTMAGMLEQADGYAELSKVLRGFKPGEIIIKDVKVMGRTVRLIQHSDNSLAILEGTKEFPLDVTAAHAADRLETDMMGNDQYYSAERMQDLIASFDIEKIESDRAEMVRVRQLLSTYIGKKTGLPTAELTNVPLIRLKTYAFSAIDDLITAKEILADIEASEFNKHEERYINTMEIQEAEKIGNVNDVRVEMHLKKEQARGEDDWNEKEQAVLDFIADLIYDQDTWVADEKEEKDVAAGERLRTLLGKHVEAVRFLIKNPEEVSEMIDKLPLPDIMVDYVQDIFEEKNPAWNDLDAADQFMKEMGQVTEANYMTEDQIKEMDEANEVAEGHIKARTIKVTLAESMKRGLFKMLRKPSMQALSLLPDAHWYTFGKDAFKAAITSAGDKELADEIAGISTKEIKDAFAAMGDSLDEMVNTFTGNLQDSMDQMVEEIFGKEEEKEEEEEEEKDEAPVQAEEVKQAEDKADEDEDDEEHEEEVLESVEELLKELNANPDPQAGERDYLDDIIDQLEQDQKQAEQAKEEKRLRNREKRERRKEYKRSKAEAEAACDPDVFMKEMGRVYTEIYSSKAEEYEPSNDWFEEIKQVKKGETQSLKHEEAKKEAKEEAKDLLEDIIGNFLKEEEKKENADAVGNPAANDELKEEVKNKAENLLVQVKNKAEEKVEEKKKDIKETLKENKKKLADQAKEKADQGKNELQLIMEQCARGEKGMGKFNKTVMKNYFGGVSMIDKRSMISSMLRGLKTNASLIPSRGELLGELKDLYYNNPDRLFLCAKEDDFVMNPEEQKIYDAYLEEKKKANIAANIMSGVLKGAGPLMQKMMQGMPMETLPEGIRGAIKDMKSNLSPIPEHLVKSAMEGIVERSKGSIEKIDVLKSLGAASVGQAFLCKVFGKNYPEGKTVVVKLLRPDVRNRMMREEKLMLKCAEDTDAGMLATYKGQLANIKKELDLTLEAKNVEAGSVYEGKHDDVVCMKLEYMVEPTANTMIAECAEGTTVDKYLDSVSAKIEEIHSRFYDKEALEHDKDKNKVVSDKYKTLTYENMAEVKKGREELQAELKKLEKMRDHVCNLSDIWVRQGMLEKGFYHGDLHAGNIMITEEKATVIDFGNAVQLNEVQQKWIIGMLTAAISGDGALFAEGFEQLLDKKDDAAFMEEYSKKKDELVKTFKDVLSKGTENDAGERIMVALLKAQELGIEIPDSVYNFAQGQIRLMNTINEMNGMMKVLMREINEMGGITSDTSHPELNPIYITQDKIFRSCRSSEVQQKDKYDQAIDSLEAADEKVVSEDMEAESGFEEKYLKSYSFIREYVTGNRTKAVKNNNDDEDDDDDDAFAQNAKGFDYLKKAQAFKDFKEKYKDAKGTEEIKKEVDRIVSDMMMFDSTNPKFDVLGGKTLLSDGVFNAMVNMDTEYLDYLIDIYENQMPLIVSMMDKYDEFKAAKKKKAKNLATVKAEFLALFKQVEENKANNSPIMLSAKSAIHRKKAVLGTKEVDYRQHLYKEELSCMFGEKTKPEGSEATYGELLKADYEKFAEAEKNEEANPSEETTQLRKAAETAFFNTFRKVSLIQLKNHRDTTYAHMTEEPKENDFLEVMRGILSNKITMIFKSLPKVGLGLGFKMVKSMLFT